MHAKLLAAMADQLARRAANHTIAGNGKCGARWGHAGDLSALMAGAPACEDCLATLHQGNCPEHCNKCAAWNLDGNDSKLDVDPPELCPQEMLPPSGMLRFKRITCDSLLAAMSITHARVSSGNWTRDKGLAHLEPEGFNPATAKQIVSNAINTKIFEE